MFENMFTTKMSMDKKSLEQRFTKIRSKNGRLSKLIAIVIFALVLAIIAFSAIYVAVRKSEEVKHTADEQQLIANALEQGEVRVSGEKSWRIGGYELRQITDKLSSMINIKIPDVKDGTYKVIEYSTELKGSGAPRIFIINTDTIELLFSARFDESVKEAYSTLETKLNEVGDYMCNIEGFTYNRILDLQSEVDKGNYLWRLDIEETLSTFFEMSDNVLMMNGKVSEVTSNETGCSGIYIKNGAEVQFEMLRPLNRKNSVWIIKSITELKKADTATVEKVDFFDEDGRQILPDANWYTVGDKVTATLYITGLRPESITAYYTDSGTEMEQYKKVVGTGKMTRDMTAVELSFDDSTYGHLWFVLDMGTHEVRSESYCVASEKNMLSATMITDKSFEMQDLKGMQDIRLVVGEKIYSPIGQTAMKRAEQMLSGAKVIKMGGTACPFDATLVIWNKDGYKSKTELATDSCAVFRSGDKYYDYSDGDNTEFFRLFGIDSKNLHNGNL